jgi:murein DD-endopeptidase MepM/ murein hydrolase activator NlpD
MNYIRFLTPILLITATLLFLSGDNPPPIPASAETQADLSTAFNQRLQSDPELHLLAFDLFTPELDTAFLTPDGKIAVLWIALRDDSGRLLATEPGFSIAHLSEDGWQVLLPGEPGWEEALTSLPEGMLPLELEPAPGNITLDSTASLASLTGYYLPYAAGTARWLEGSISHFQSIPELGYPSCSEVYCRYAYDFTDSWHFPLLASKNGTVFAARDSCFDGDPNCTNYMVLYNASDQAYQIYLHLAHNTIPSAITPGSTVLRGQYIGDSDDTGYSTSQHVHFMVANSIWMGSSGYYWGQSIDIRFADVAINNGIPRTCYEVTHFPIYNGAIDCLGDKSDPRNLANDWYVSGNVGAYPPTGSLSRPLPGAVVGIGNSPLIDVSATASDDVRVTAVSLVANLDNQWVEIGPKITQPTQPGVYDWDVDLCAATGHNGSLDVALRIWDYEGNVSQALNPRTIQVDHACPPPTSELKPAKTFDSTAVHLSWDATSAGAGFGSFDLQWRSEPGVWDAANILTLPGYVRSTWFAGQPGGSYAFRLRARDANNQPEPWPAADAFETSASLPATCLPDSFEPDDDYTQAKVLSLGTEAQRNLCGVDDPDWFKVEIPDAKDYSVIARSIFGGAAVDITVYAGDGGTVLVKGQAAGIGQPAMVRLRDAVAGVYYIKVEPLTNYLIGTDAVYGLSIMEAHDVFYPLVVR